MTAIWPRPSGLLLWETTQSFLGIVDLSEGKALPIGTIKQYGAYLYVKVALGGKDPWKHYATPGTAKAKEALAAGGVIVINGEPVAAATPENLQKHKVTHPKDAPPPPTKKKATKKKAKKAAKPLRFGELPPAPEVPPPHWSLALGPVVSPPPVEPVQEQPPAPEPVGAPEAPKKTVPILDLPAGLTWSEKGLVEPDGSTFIMAGSTLHTAAKAAAGVVDKLGIENFGPNTLRATVKKAVGAGVPYEEVDVLVQNLKDYGLVVDDPADAGMFMWAGPLLSDKEPSSWGADGLKVGGKVHSPSSWVTLSAKIAAANSPISVFDLASKIKEEHGIKYGFAAGMVQELQDKGLLTVNDDNILQWAGPPPPLPGTPEPKPKEGKVAVKPSRPKVGGSWTPAGFVTPNGSTFSPGWANHSAMELAAWWTKSGGGFNIFALFSMVKKKTGEGDVDAEAAITHLKSAGYIVPSAGSGASYHWVGPSLPPDYPSPVDKPDKVPGTSKTAVAEPDPIKQVEKDIEHSKAVDDTTNQLFGAPPLPAAFSGAMPAAQLQDMLTYLNGAKFDENEAALMGSSIFTSHMKEKYGEDWLTHYKSAKVKPHVTGWGADGSLVLSTGMTLPPGLPFHTVAKIAATGQGYYTPDQISKHPKGHPLGFLKDALALALQKVSGIGLDHAEATVNDIENAGLIKKKWEDSETYQWSGPAYPDPAEMEKKPIDLTGKKALAFGPDGITLDNGQVIGANDFIYKVASHLYDPNGTMISSGVLAFKLGISPTYQSEVGEVLAKLKDMGLIEPEIPGTDLSNPATYFKWVGPKKNEQPDPATLHKKKGFSEFNFGGVAEKSEKLTFHDGEVWTYGTHKDEFNIAKSLYAQPLDVSSLKLAYPAVAVDKALAKLKEVGLVNTDNWEGTAYWSGPKATSAPDMGQATVSSTEISAPGVTFKKGVPGVYGMGFDTAQAIHDGGHITKGQLSKKLSMDPALINSFLSSLKGGGLIDVVGKEMFKWVGPPMGEKPLTPMDIIDNPELLKEPEVPKKKKAAKKTKTPAVYADLPPAGSLYTPQVPALSDLEYVQNAGHLGGAGEKHLYKDKDGNQWLLKVAAEKAQKKKSKPFAAFAQEAVSQVAMTVKPFHVAVGVVPLPDKGKNMMGTVQKMVALAPSPDLRNTSPSDLSDQEKEDVASEHLIDWMMGQHDSHPGNLLRTKEGRIIGIDKEQAFKYFKDDKLDTEYHPNAVYGENEPFYNTFWRDFGNNKHDFNPQKMRPSLEAIEAINNNDYVTSLLGYAEASGKDEEAQQEFLTKAKNRKITLRRDFEKFVSEQYKKRTGKDGAFTFNDGWNEKGEKKTKMVVTGAEALAEKAGIRVRPYKPKASSPEDPSKLTLKVGKGELPKLESFLKKWNIPMTADSPVVGSQYDMAFVNKADFDKAQVSEEVVIDESSGVQAHSGKATYFPMEVLHNKSVPNAKELSEVGKVPLGHMGKKFTADGPALEGQLITAKKRVNTNGDTYYQYHFKLRQQVWKDLKGDGVSDSIALPSGTYDETKDAIEDQPGSSLTLSSQRWGDEYGSSIHLAVGGGQYAYQGGVYAKVFPKPGESPDDLFRGLLNKMKPGLADELSKEPTEEEREVLKLSRALWSYAPQKADALSEEERTVPKLTALLKGRVTKEDLDSIKEVEYMPGHTTHVLPGRWRSLVTDDNGAPALSFLRWGAGDTSRVVSMLTTTGLNGVHERLLNGHGYFGTSASGDDGTGGSDNMTVRAITKSGHYDQAHSGTGGGNYAVVIAPDELDRLDVFMYNGDEYGATNPNGPHGSAWKNRKTLASALSYQEKNYSSSAEVVIRRGVSKDKILRVVANTEDKRKALIEGLKAKGVTEIRGMPVEDFVVVETNNGQIYEKYVKPLYG